MQKVKRMTTEIINIIEDKNEVFEKDLINVGFTESDIKNHKNQAMSAAVKQINQCNQKPQNRKKGARP